MADQILFLTELRSRKKRSIELIIIIIIYFLPIFELYMISQHLQCLLLSFVSFGERDNRKASLSAVAVSYPITIFSVIPPKFLSKISTYVQNGAFKFMR